ncbi:hypothetical protein AB9P05_05410 [Roseivirga sp. BDSF3-8]|uniref:hypothetical protein n=1 Tax=Roseivirga sp. BDSF3-8 TaxID=3241598 RepID=UPI00353270C4
MELALTQEISREVLESNKSDIIQELSDKMNFHFKDKFYGEDIQSILIGVICVPAEAEFFFKKRKPKYKKGRGKIVVDGVEVFLENSLRYDIKLSYDHFMSGDMVSAYNMISDEVLSSIAIINSVKEIKKFQMDCFYSDLYRLLKNTDLKK